MDAEALLEVLIAAEPAARKRDKTNRTAIQTPVEKLLPLMKRLRQDARLVFDLLLDHTAIDWLAEGRFELVYNLYSTIHGHSLMIFTSVPRDNPVAPTVSEIWPTAHWQEREVFDLFGVLYDDHPDLRRLFLDDDWKGNPLRKDYQDDFMLARPR